MSKRKRAHALHTGRGRTRTPYSRRVREQCTDKTKGAPWTGEQPRSARALLFTQRLPARPPPAPASHMIVGHMAHGCHPSTPAAAVDANARAAASRTEGTAPPTPAPRPTPHGPPTQTGTCVRAVGRRGLAGGTARRGRRRASLRHRWRQRLSRFRVIRGGHARRSSEGQRKGAVPPSIHAPIRYSIRPRYSSLMLPMAKISEASTRVAITRNRTCGIVAMRGGGGRQKRRRARRVRGVR